MCETNDKKNKFSEKIKSLFKSGEKPAFEIEFHTSKTNIILTAVVFLLVYAVFFYAVKTNIYESLFIAALSAVSVGAPVKIKTNGGGKAFFATIICLLSIPLSFLVVETLNGNVIWEDLTDVQIILNFALYSAFFLFWLVILSRPYYSAVVTSAFFIFAGVANHYVLNFRGTIIFPGDLMSIRTAANVADNFNFTPDKIMIFAIAVFIAYFILARRTSRGVTFKRHIASTLGYFASAGVFFYCFFATDMLPNLDIYAQQWKTQANGYVLNFATAMRYSRIQKPDGYSEEAAKKVMDAITAQAAPIGTKPDNIIVVMNESFADYSDFKNLTLSEDPCPFYHSLTENTIKGQMYSPVSGGGTANVEYEYLTGNSMSFIPDGTVPYQLYLKNGAPSIVEQMNELGYHTSAFHPFLASGWNRNNAYNYLGFDDKYFMDDVKNPTLIRQYISDKSDYEKIFEITDNAKDPQFIFNVTIQNHSAYDNYWPDQKYHVQPSGQCVILNSTTTAEQFFSLIKESDDALKELVEHYSKSDKKTMIVFFGDHQPPLNSRFYQFLYRKNLDSRSIDEVLEEYNTPFFIWANYDIPEAENVKISTNFLGILTMKAANLPLTGYQTFLDRLSATFPIFSTVATEDIHQNAVSRTEDDTLDDTSRTLINDYSYLNYYNIFSSYKDSNNFYNYTPKTLEQYKWTLKAQNSANP